MAYLIFSLSLLLIYMGLGTIRYPIRIGDGSEFLYFACLLALIVVLQMLVLRLHRSPTGQLLLAIRDNEELCASLGKDTFRVKMFWFVATCMVMCMLGAFSASLNQFLTPNMLLPSVTFAVWIALVLGGKEHSLGALIGIFLTFGLFDILIETYAPVTPELAVVVPNLKLFLYGLLLVGVLIYRPSGLLSSATPPEAVLPMIRTAIKTGTAVTISTVQSKVLGKSSVQYTILDPRPENSEQANEKNVKTSSEPNSTVSDESKEDKV